MGEEQLTWAHLEQFGLALTYREGSGSGWGYSWRGRTWQGPYETRMVALAAAFAIAIESMLLSDLCPFRIGECPLLRLPPPGYVQAEQDRDEDEKDPWSHDKDWED